MHLSSHEKQQLQLIHEQVTLLLAKKASDDTILDALFDFIPDIKCIQHAVDSRMLTEYIKPYAGLCYFINLVFSLENV